MYRGPMNTVIGEPTRGGFARPQLGSRPNVPIGKPPVARGNVRLLWLAVPRGDSY